MAQLNFNTSNIRRVPVNRNNLFYSKEAFDFDIKVGKEYIEEDMNQTVVLYPVDISKTNINDVYGETKEDGVSFSTPVEFHCVYEIEEPELRAYDKTKNIGTYMKFGKLKVGVYKATLDELGIMPKIGDYIGVQLTEENMEFWSISFINPNYNNAHTMYGRVPFYYEILAYKVEKSEFNA